MQDSDQDLIARVGSGDLAAFEDLVARYEKRVYSVAYRYCGNATDAADLAQEAFLKIFRGLPAFRGEAGFLTWVYHITANVCRDHLRKRQREKKLLLEEKPGEKISSARPSGWPSNPEEAILQGELQDEIQQALNALTEDYRLILVMREMEGFSYEEIASQLGCSLGTVKSRLNRARQAFREKYLSLQEPGRLPNRQTK